MPLNHSELYPNSSHVSRTHTCTVIWLSMSICLPLSRTALVNKGLVECRGTHDTLQYTVLDGCTQAVLVAPANYGYHTHINSTPPLFDGAPSHTT